MRRISGLLKDKAISSLRRATAVTGPRSSVHLSESPGLIETFVLPIRCQLAANRAGDIMPSAEWGWLAL